MSDSATQSTAAVERASDVRGTNQSGMRAHNERLVLSLVRQHHALAKAELAQMSGLSAQTVSVIMRQLERDGLLLRGDPVRGKVGQPSIPMRLNPDGAYFLGLKVGRRSTELVRTDFLGTVLDRSQWMYAYPTPEEILSFAKGSLHEMVTGLPARASSKIAGVGIAMPFFLWDWAQTLQVAQDRMDTWREADLQSSLEADCAFPVFVQNDATAACGAELIFGPRDGPRDFLYFYVGYFIGGGIVLNGQIFSGRGNAAALGPMPVPNKHGGVDPLIDVASLYLLERSVLASGGNVGPIWQSVETWNIDEDHLDAWISQAAFGIAHAIVSACSLIDFQTVKIDGWMPSDVRDRLIAKIEDCMSRSNMTGLERPQLQAGTIGPDARALGAASLPLSDKYLVEG